MTYIIVDISCTTPRRTLPHNLHATSQVIQSGQAESPPTRHGRHTPTLHRPRRPSTRYTPDHPPTPRKTFSPCALVERSSTHPTSARHSRPAYVFLLGRVARYLQSARQLSFRRRRQRALRKAMVRSFTTGGREAQYYCQSLTLACSSVFLCLISLLVCLPEVPLSLDSTLRMVQG